MTIHPQSLRPDTAPNDRTYAPVSHDRCLLWRKFSEAINTLKATATHKLTATSLSLSERDGIGDLHTPPVLTDQAGAPGFSLDAKARQTRGVPDN